MRRATLLTHLVPEPKLRETYQKEGREARTANDAESAISFNRLHPHCLILRANVRKVGRLMAGMGRKLPLATTYRVVLVHLSEHVLIERREILYSIVAHRLPG